MTPSPVELFYSYAHEDEPYRSELATHLALLRRRGLVREWHDRVIDAGSDWNSKINEALHAADIILLLISADFIASDYCFGKELTTALKQHDEERSRVIPVIVRPVDDWQSAPFGHLQALPTDGRAVSLWANRDEAWITVVRGIRGVVEASTSRAAHRDSVPPEITKEETEFIARGVQRFNEHVRFAAAQKKVRQEPAEVNQMAWMIANVSRPRRVLWVDDHPRNNAHETYALFALQVDVEAVLDTESALARLRARPADYDLLISDWQRMPQQDPRVAEGIRLLQEMRTERIPIPAIVYHGAFDSATMAARDEAVKAEGGLGATPDPVMLLRWCVHALGLTGAPPVASPSAPGIQN